MTTPNSPAQAPMAPATPPAAAPAFPAFDLAGPLPEGLTVLEASAGTGKTWAIAALATRYLADGLVKAPDLLAVTFTHLASADLRSRLYQRLTATVASLETGPGDGPPDTLAEIIGSGSPEIVAARLARLRQAVSDFDGATVATIHEFCRRAADWLGPLAGPGPARIDDEATAALAEQTVADLTLARRLAGADDPPADECAALGRAALANPEVPIVPPGSEAARFATACRDEYARRKMAAGVADFSDLALRLDRALGDAVSGPLVADALAQRYHVILVDEFQDTDPVQWSILRRAFAGRRPLVLVGDPKQSIYGFRGADVHAYLEAVGQAGATYTLPVNYRSDAPVVEAVNELFAGAGFGQADAPIPMRASTPAHTAPRLRPPSPDGPAAPDYAGSKLTSGLEIRRLPGFGSKQRAAIEADAVAWVAQALARRPQLQRPDGRWRALRADDIAVLVSSNQRGAALSNQLRAAGLPAVFSGAASVFASPAAGEWLLLLDALAHPRPDTLRRAMAGRLIGVPLAVLAEKGDDTALAWSARLREWAGQGAGPAAVLAQLEATCDLAARLLGATDGERLLTDVRHLAELLAGQARRLATPADLAVWLRAQYRRAAESGSGDRTRRLETDRPAVSVLTVHAAKGLEFPVVLVPATADAARHTWGSPNYPLLTRADGHRVLSLRASGPGQADQVRAWADEEAAEERRRLYVSLTRGSSLVVAWLGDRRAAFSQLASGLENKLPEDAVPGGMDRQAEEGAIVGLSRPTTTQRGAQLASHAGIRLVAVPDTPPVLPAAVGPVARPPLLGANSFSRVIDDDWVRTSYSGLTAGLHDAAPAGAPDDSAIPGTDEAELAPTTPTAVSPDETGVHHASTAPHDLVSPMEGLPAGAAFGTVVHAVLEACDPASPALADDLAAAVTRLRERSTLPGLDATHLADALVQVLRTPLGPLAGDASLAGLGAGRRLTELTFELPLGDAAPSPRDAGKTGYRLADLAALFDDPALVPPGDPLAGYGAQLAGSEAARRSLRGFLTGSIDDIVELPDGRVLLIDYKTNRLGPPDQPDQVANYQRGAMAAAMRGAHYPLQALLYAVALRRYLAWRRPAPDFDTQWAGVAYLFVRGMAGPATPLSGGMPCGVFGWRPAPALIERADAILRGGES